MTIFTTTSTSEKQFNNIAEVIDSLFGYVPVVKQESKSRYDTVIIDGKLVNKLPFGEHVYSGFAGYNNDSIESKELKENVLIVKFKKTKWREADVEYFLIPSKEYSGQEIKVSVNIEDGLLVINTTTDSKEEVKPKHKITVQ